MSTAGHDVNENRSRGSVGMMQAAWNVETWKEDHFARRARLMSAARKIPASPLVKIIDLRPRPKVKAATLYLMPIGPRWHTEMYDAPIGPSQARMNGAPAAARQIMREAAEKHGITVAELTGSRRTRTFVRARQEAIWRIWGELHWSLPRIGRFLGGRDHTTVLHSIRKHQALIDAQDGSLRCNNG